MIGNDMQEFVCLVREDATQTALKAADAHGVSVLHQYDSLWIVAAVDAKSADEFASADSGVLELHQVGSIPPEFGNSLNDVAKSVLDAVRSQDYDDASGSETVAEQQVPQPRNGCIRVYPGEISNAGDEPDPTPLSERLTGSVSVGLVFIEGRTPELEISLHETTGAVLAAKKGLGWLGQQPKTPIRWSWRVIRVTIDTPADAPVKESEDRFLWPALERLGLDPSPKGVYALSDRLRQENHTDWSYCVFLTKYPGSADPYAAEMDGVKWVVMNPINDGSGGTSEQPQTFAHETGHVFGAPDEYEGCSCTELYGYYQRPNTNCVECPGGGKPCVMNACSWALCSATPYHLGFAGLPV